ncbi:MAG: MerR family transcriptional regulator [Phycisphaerae bacterium]|nr:MerR family transcriptional regulator [Phycisphaerae bacterium]
MEPLKKISEVGREVGLSDRRIREYERVGLIRPRREPRTRDRLYGPKEVAQLRLIKELVRKHSLTLENIRMLLAYAPCWELTDCPVRDRCPVLKDPTTPCYLQPAHVCGQGEDCLHCPIYRSKDRPRCAIVVTDGRVDGNGSGGILPQAK